MTTKLRPWRALRRLELAVALALVSSCAAQQHAPLAAAPSVAASPAPPADATPDEPAAATRRNKWWLMPRRKLQTGRTSVSIGMHAGRLLVFDGHYRTLLYREVDAPVVVLDDRVPKPWRVKSAPSPFLADWLFAEEGERIGAFDAQTFEPAWQLALSHEHRLHSVSRVADVAVLSTLKGSSSSAQHVHELLGVEVPSGRVLWRRETLKAAHGVGWTAAADGVVWVITGAERERYLEVLEPRTGATLWKDERSWARDVLVSGRFVVIATSGSLPLELETREARSGRLVAKATVPGQYRQHALLDGDRVYTMTDRLTALSVSTLETLWSHPVEPGPLRQPANIALGYQELSAGEGAVTLCENSTLRAFDRLSGAQLWSYGMEPSGCGTFALLPGPRLYVPLTARYPEDERADDGIVEFAPSHLPAETAIIRGTVPSFESHAFATVSPAGSKVTVDNTVVEVSETGSYEAKVTSRGVVRVDVHVPLPDDEDNEKCNPGAQGHAEVPLTGAGQYGVDLELARDCW